MKKKLFLPSEVAYVLAGLIMAFSVAMITATNYGVSMIVAPAYLLSLKTGLTFGQCEYIVQGGLFLILCVAMKKFKPLFLCSFLTGLLYGAFLDAWRWLIPHFNPEITAPGSLPIPLKLCYFVVGMSLTSLAVAMYFRVYLYPQVYDFFVKGLTDRYHLNRTRFKLGYDISSLAVSCAMAFLLFRKFVGVGVGTLVMTACNGLLIDFFGKVLDRFFEIRPMFPKLASRFELG